MITVWAGAEVEALVADGTVMHGSPAILTPAHSALAIGDHVVVDGGARVVTRLVSAGRAVTRRGWHRLWELSAEEHS